MVWGRIMIGGKNDLTFSYGFFTEQQYLETIRNFHIMRDIAWPQTDLLTIELTYYRSQHYPQT